MRKIFIRRIIIPMAILFSLLILLVAGCSGTPTLAEVEISEYQGEKLGSLDDFRENSIKGVQYVNIEDYYLQIGGLVNKPLSYTYDEVLNKFEKYKKVVTLHCVEGWSVKLLWEGMLIGDILAESDISPEAKVVIFHAYDGYATSLPLDFILSSQIMLAYKINDVIIPPERGFPFQVIAESKWGYKWIKWVTEMELSSDENYRGYWESRGFSNNADLDRYFGEN